MPTTSSGEREGGTEEKKHFGGKVSQEFICFMKTGNIDFT